MIDWVAFLVVLAVSIVGACGVVFLFAMGLRFVTDEGHRLRPLGVAFFVLCGLAILFGIYLIIPALHS